MNISVTKRGKKLLSLKKVAKTRKWYYTRGMAQENIGGKVYSLVDTPAHIYLITRGDEILAWDVDWVHWYLVLLALGVKPKDIKGMNEK